MRCGEATLDTPRGVDASVARRAGLLAVPILILLVAAFATPAPRLGLRAHDSAALPLGASGVVARTLARDDPRFSVRRVSGGFAAAGAGLAARFTRDDVVVNGDGLSWSLGLRAVGRGDHVTVLAAGAPRGRANEVRYNRGSVEEWYANTRLGLEQGFTLTARAPGTAPVTLAIGVLPRGVEPQVGGDRRSVILTRGGRVLMRYSRLFVSDARGRSLPAWIETSGRHLRLRVDDRDARYPLRVDPFVQVAKLTASNGVAGDDLGAAIAVSADTIAVGAPNVGSGRGAVYVFVKPPGGWADATETAMLTASDGAGNNLLGSSVAMSGDTIVAGAPRASISGHQAQGAAYVFTKPGAGWTDGTETTKLTAADGATSDQFGSSVASDGSTIVVGAQWASPNAFFGAGAAYVFVNGVQQAKLLATLGQPEDNFGSSVGVSGDTVAVGAGSAGNFAGAVYVFVKPTGGWTDGTQTAKLLASDGGQSDHLGISLGVSGDTVAAGANDATVSGQRRGAVYVFVKPSGGWTDGTQTAKLSASDGAAGDQLGVSVGIGSDTIVAGAPGAGGNSQGAVYLFSKPPAGWADGTESTKLVASDETGGDGFGESAGVTGDGAFVAAGSPSAAGVGAAYAFISSGGARSTATSGTCLPASVAAGQATTCTATVSDTAGGSTASGSVTFSSDSSGNFGSGNSCRLTATGAAGAASCDVTYTPAAAGTHTITARYGGDASHDPSSGSATVTVSPGSGTGGGGGGIPIASFAPPGVVRAGAVTTLNASASTDAVSYQWDLNGDGTSDVTCGTPQLQTQFLPVTAVKPGGDRATGHAVPVAHVSLTVVSATGQTSSVTQTVSVANANAALPAAAAGFYRNTQNAVCSGAGVMSHTICVVGTKDTFGVIEAQGCDLHQVTGTKDLSALEDRAVIQRAIDQYNNNGAFATYANALCISAVLAGDVPNCRISQQLDQRDITGLLDSGSIELYECRGPVYINGLLFLPGDGHPLVISPQLNTIFWSHTEIDLNGKALPLPSSGTFNFHDVKAPLTAIGPVYDRQSPPFAVDMHVPSGALPGLIGLTPQTATLSFARSTNSGRYVRIDASLALPSLLTAALSSGPPTLQSTFTQSNETDLQIGHIHVDNLPSIGYGPIGVDDVSVDYDGANPQPLRITGKINFLGTHISFAPEQPYHLDNGILFYGRQFQHAGATLDFSCPLLCPPELFPGVTLDSISFNISRNPWVLGGGADLGVVDLVTVHGGIDVAFASDDDPWTLNSVVRPELPDFFAPQTFTTLTVAAAGDATVNLPIIGDEPLAHGYVIYAYPGYVSFGGRVTWSLLGIVSFDGGLSGEFNAVNKRFNFTGHLQSCVVDVICSGAFGVVSSAGAGACFSVGPVNVGGGVQFPSHVYIWPLDGCKWSRFTEDHVFDGARDARARGRQADLRPYVVHIAPGDPSRAISLDGDGEAPAVHVTGPGGQDVSSSTGDCTPATDTEYNGSTCLTMVGRIRIMRSPTSHQTVVGLQSPPPGTYTISPQPSSSGFAQVFTADDPASPRITGSVAAAGASRTLHYNVGRLPDEKVTFLDVGPQGAREIGTAKGGTTGALTFTPAPGSATHFVEAEVEMAGLPVPMLGGASSGALDASAARAAGQDAAMMTIARFHPPRLVHAGRIGHVRLHRQSALLRVTWRKARGALRYVVTLRLRNGRLRTIIVPRTSTRITGVPRTEAGQVTIAAIGNDGRPGPAVRARFRATAKARTILQPLR